MINNQVEIQIGEEPFRAKVRRKTTKTEEFEQILAP
jgi:hypothetical protein